MPQQIHKSKQHHSSSSESEQQVEQARLAEEADKRAAEVRSQESVVVVEAERTLDVIEQVLGWTGLSAEVTA